MPLAPKLPERIPFEKLSRVPYGAPEPLPFKLVGFRKPERGEWYASGAEPAGYLALGDLTSPYWIIEPILNDAQRRQFRVQDWWRVAKPLTIWLVRDGRRAIKVLNPDRKYVGEFLIETPLGRTALCAVLLSMANAGYRIVREDNGDPVDPKDTSLSALR
jgi:hypothetical protein